jgi:hypothetical protein
MPRHSKLINLVVLATIVGAAVATTAPAAAARPAQPTAAVITATPDADLVDGQLVRVEGDGFAPSSIFEIFECAGDSVDETRCDPRNAFEFDSDATGHIVFDFHVDARIYLGPAGATEYDCRTEPAGCRIGVGLMLEHENSAFAALGFDPSAPLLPPVSATVSPSTGLVDGQMVTVTGDHLSDIEEGWVIQCRTGGAPRACDLDRAVRLVPEGGNLTTAYAVHATFTSPLGDHVDCEAAANACSMVVSWGFAFVADRVAEVGITFGSTTTTTGGTTTTSVVPLAVTGGSSPETAAVGVALVVLGAAALFLARRVRRAA